jgi:hypothetical protein
MMVDFIDAPEDKLRVLRRRRYQNSDYAVRSSTLIGKPQDKRQRISESNHVLVIETSNLPPDPLKARGGTCSEGALRAILKDAVAAVQDVLDSICYTCPEYLLASPGTMLK